MKNSDGGFEQAYNGQAVVDDTHPGLGTRQLDINYEEDANDYKSGTAT